MTIFWVKSSLGNSLKICPNFFFFNISKIKKFNFVKFMSPKNGITTSIFHLCLSLLFLDPVSGIRDPGSEIRDKHPGSATLLTLVSLTQLGDFKFVSVEVPLNICFYIINITTYRLYSTPGAAIIFVMLLWILAPTLLVYTWLYLHWISAPVLLKSLH